MIEYRNTSLADKVYEVLEHNILCGVYAPGEIVTESRLSTDLGVSRTPIREALSKLSHEKLVKETKSGIKVVGISEEDVKDLFEVKRRIEVLATKRAALNLNEKKLALLQDNIERQEFYAQKGDAEKVRDLDTEFHDIIYKGSGSTTFETILSPIHHKMMKFRRLSLESHDRIYDSVAEHKALYEAIRDRDADKAETVILLHIDHSYNNLKKEVIE